MRGSRQGVWALWPEQWLQTLARPPDTAARTNCSEPVEPFEPNRQPSALDDVPSPGPSVTARGCLGCVDLQFLIADDQDAGRLVLDPEVWPKERGPHDGRARAGWTLEGGRYQLLWASTCPERPRTGLISPPKRPRNPPVGCPGRNLSQHGGRRYRVPLSLLPKPGAPWGVDPGRRAYLSRLTGLLGSHMLPATTIRCIRPRPRDCLQLVVVALVCFASLACRNRRRRDAGMRRRRHPWRLTVTSPS